jgi:hypothetical protein
MNKEQISRKAMTDWQLMQLALDKLNNVHDDTFFISACIAKKN